MHDDHFYVRSIPIFNDDDNDEYDDDYDTMNSGGDLFAKVGCPFPSPSLPSPSFLFTYPFPSWGPTP